MHTQREVNIQIVEQGGDYLWTVKENQPTLHGNLERLFDPDLVAFNGGPETLDFRTARTVEKGHGRIEDVAHLRQGQEPHVLATLNNTVVGLVLKHGYANLAQARRVMDYLLNKYLHQICFSWLP